jgi:hypothetical protein
MLLDTCVPILLLVAVELSCLAKQHADVVAGLQRTGACVSRDGSRQLCGTHTAP